MKNKLKDNGDSFLLDFIKKSKESYRVLILRLLNKGMNNIEVADLLDISISTVSRIKNK
ncbi:MAG: helix-turn-helix domain-containing protein [Methanobrevibacter sp.]|jgi:DNA-binding NarL/FixJ family response regulator|nr:helix-turn-helix domain-containing protein [Candidatus Methanovirga basalitermitum]